MKSESDLTEEFQKKAKILRYKRKRKSQNVKDNSQRGAKQIRDKDWHRSPTQMTRHVEKDEKNEEPWTRAPHWWEAVVREKEKKR